MGELVSQSKFFIDGQTTGSLQLLKVKSADIDDERDAELVNALGVKTAAGVRRKPGGGTVSLDVYEEQGKPEVDWFKQQDLEAYFALTTQDVGGMRDQYWCTVAKVTRKKDENGSNMLTVKLVYTRKQRLPNTAIAS